MRLKFAVIGEPCMDYIHRGKSDSGKQFGGILYSIVSLAVIAQKSGEVYPIMNLGEDEFENVTSFLYGFKNIKLDYVYRCSHKTRVVNLYYKSPLADPGPVNYDREESSTEPTLPVSYEQISPALGIVDALLINMVSGVDLTLNTLKLVRNGFTGYIHMDVHNLVMQTWPDGKRSRGPLKDWIEWCINCDTLQMNEAEAEVISGENPGEYNTTEKILSTGKVKTVIVTRGKQGASLYTENIKNPGGEKYFDLDKIDVPAIENPHFKESTGCGDVFASAFLYKSTENKLANLSASLHFANRIASIKSGLGGPEQLLKLND